MNDKEKDLKIFKKIKWKETLELVLTITISVIILSIIIGAFISIGVSVTNRKRDEEIVLVVEGLIENYILASEGANDGYTVIYDKETKVLLKIGIDEEGKMFAVHVISLENLILQKIEISEGD